MNVGVKKPNLDKVCNNLQKTTAKVETQLQQIEKFGSVVESYTVKLPLGKRLVTVISSTIKTVFEKISKKAMKGQIFYGWKSSLKLKSLQKQLKVEQNALKKADTKLANCKPEEKKGLTTIKDILTSKVNTTQTKLNKELGYAKKATQTRNHFTRLGGVELNIKTGDGKSTINAVHIKADSFRATMKNSGCKLSQIKVGKSTVSAIQLPKGENKTQFYKSIQTLGLFKNDLMKEIKTSDGSTLLVDRDTLNTLANEKTLFSGASKSDLILDTDRVEISSKEIDLTQKSNGGTVVISSGNAGVYEMHKGEMLAFLVKGMDVVGFNPPGYGKSEGIPSSHSFNSSTEAVYDYLAKDQKIPDNKILFKALCLSGGAATKVANKHPNLNLFLDQTYSDFKDTVKSNIKEEINSKLGSIKSTINRKLDPIKDKINKKLGISPKDDSFSKEDKSKILKYTKKFINKNIDIASTLIAKVLSPKWSVHQDIKNINGHVGIMYTHDDTLFPADKEVAKNLKERIAEGKGAVLYGMAGDHGTSWVTNKDSNKELGDDAIFSVSDQNAFETLAQNFLKESVGEESMAKYESYMEGLTDKYNEIKDYLSPSMSNAEITETLEKLLENENDEFLSNLLLSAFQKIPPSQREFAISDNEGFDAFLSINLQAEVGKENMAKYEPYMEYVTDKYNEIKDQFSPSMNKTEIKEKLEELLQDEDEDYFERLSELFLDVFSCSTAIVEDSDGNKVEVIKDDSVNVDQYSSRKQIDSYLNPGI